MKQLLVNFMSEILDGFEKKSKLKRSRGFTCSLVEAEWVGG